MVPQEGVADADAHGQRPLEGTDHRERAEAGVQRQAALGGENAAHGRDGKGRDLLHGPGGRLAERRDGESEAAPPV